MQNPFSLTLYDKTFRRGGWLGDALEVTAVPRHNLASSLDFTVASNNAKLGLLTTPGARVTCDFAGDQIISGPVRMRSGKGPYSQGTISFSVEDDFRLLSRVLGWPVPTASLTGQTSEYYTVTGAAETVVKDLITKNAVTRLGLPVTVAPDQARGSSVTVSARFHPLYDRLFPAVETAGIGVTVKQSGAGLLVDCYTPRTYPRELTEASGVVTEWSWSNAAPEATRGVIGGQGDGTARAFQSFIDPSRESDWGDVIEVFKDSRDTADASVYAQRATETLAETQEKSGLKIKFSQTKNFQYGPAGVQRGDKITLRVGPALAVTDTLREAEISWTRDKGLEVSPKVGDVTDSTDLIFARALRKNAADIRMLRSK